MKNISLRNLKSIVIVFISLNFFSCSNSEEIPTCNVTSFSTTNIFYDELRFTSFVYNPTWTGRINLVYDSNNRIIKTIGGLRNIAAFSPGSGPNFGMYNDVEEDIIYNGSAVSVTSQHLYTKEFVIDSNQLLSQKTTYSSSIYFGDLINPYSGLLEYEYAGNTIFEKKNGITRRIFYLEDGNLVRVDSFLFNSSNEIIKKYEYLFLEYDTNPNLLKGKFFINGYFFKAFSNNNYKRYELRGYDKVNGVYELIPAEFSYFYYSALPSDMFLQDCQ